MPPTPQKILIITRNFPPLTGGMERLIFKATEGLAKNADITLIGPKDCDRFLPQETQKSIQGYGPRSSTVSAFLLYALIKSTLGQFKKSNYHFILGGSGLVAPIVYLSAKLNKAKSVLVIHGLDIIANNIIYQTIFVWFIKRCDHIIANSHNTKRLAIEAGVSPSKITVVFPGVDIPDHLPSTPDKQITQKYKNNPVILSVGRLIPRKGLPQFLEKSFPVILSKYPDAHLVIIGEEPKQAINQNQKSVLAQIKTIIARDNLEKNVSLLGKVSDAQLETYYSIARCFIFPLTKMKGDVEGFGMVAIEAAAHGTPTVAFNEGGVADAISEGESGYLITPGDYDDFASKVVDLLEKTVLTQEECMAFAKKFCWNTYNEKLRAAFDTLQMAK